MNKTLLLMTALALTSCGSSTPATDNDDLEMSMPSQQTDGESPPAESTDNSEDK
jgi:hypothetical protein